MAQAKPPLAHFEVSPETFARANELRIERQKAAPHRVVPLAEVWREIVAAGLDAVALKEDK